MIHLLMASALRYIAFRSIQLDAIERFGDFDYQLCAMPDHELSLRIASVDGHKVPCIPEPLTL